MSPCRDTTRPLPPAECRHCRRLRRAAVAPDEAMSAPPFAAYGKARIETRMGRNVEARERARDRGSEHVTPRSLSRASHFKTSRTAALYIYIYIAVGWARDPDLQPLGARSRCPCERRKRRRDTATCARTQRERQRSGRPTCAQVPTVDAMCASGRLHFLMPAILDARCQPLYPGEES